MHRFCSFSLARFQIIFPNEFRWQSLLLLLLGYDERAVVVVQCVSPIAALRFPFPQMDKLRNDECELEKKKLISFLDDYVIMISD